MFVIINVYTYRTSALQATSAEAGCAFPVPLAHTLTRKEPPRSNAPGPAREVASLEPFLHVCMHACMYVCMCTSLSAGHYCLEASNSITQFPCGGSGFYCKEGSALPSPAHEGFYTATSGYAIIQHLRSDTSLFCNHEMYVCSPDAGAQAYWDPSNTTNSVELPCEPGTANAA